MAMGNLRRLTSLAAVAVLTLARPGHDEPQLRPTTVRARLGLEWFRFRDESAYGESFSQPAVTVRLNAQQLFRRHMDLSLRLRSKYNQRSRTINAAAPEDEWRHRVYYLNLSWADPALPYALRFGRLRSSRMRGVGNWDGVQVDARLAEDWTAGAFGGFQPDLHDSGVRLKQQKCGGFLAYEHGDLRSARYRSTLGLVGQYESGDISREYLYLQNELSLGRRLRLHQNMDVDLSRGWKRAVGADRLELSQLYAMLRLQVAPWLAITGSYDSRKRIRRIETRYIPESLFVDPRQRGLRLRLDLRPRRTVCLGTSWSVRDTEGQDKAASAIGSYVRWQNAFATGVAVSLRHSYAQNRLVHGHVLAARLSRTFSRRFSSGVSGGTELLEGERGGDMSLDNQWLQLRGSWVLPAGYDAQWSLTRYTGDVRQGNQALLRLGYRL